MRLQDTLPTTISSPSSLNGICPGSTLPVGSTAFVAGNIGNFFFTNTCVLQPDQTASIILQGTLSGAFEMITNTAIVSLYSGDVVVSSGSASV